jgi:hypothetical protein
VVKQPCGEEFMVAKALEDPVKLPPRSPVQVHASSATLPETGASDIWQIPVAVMVAVAQSEAQLQRVLQHDREEAPANKSPLQAIPLPAALASEHVTEESKHREVTPSAETVQAMAMQRADLQHGTGFCSELSNEHCAASCTAADAEASRQETTGAECDPSSRKNKCCSTAPMKVPCSEDAHASDVVQDEQGTSEGLCKVRSSRHSLSTQEACAAFQADTASLTAGRLSSTGNAAAVAQNRKSTETSEESSGAAPYTSIDNPLATEADERPASETVHDPELVSSSSNEAWHACHM